MNEPPLEGPLAIRCGTLLDCTSEQPKRDQIILLENGRIKEVGKEGSIDIPKGARRIDATEKVVMPGLVDVHTHLIGIRTWNPMDWLLDFSSGLATIRAVVDVKSYLEAGYTTVQDAGSRVAIQLRDAVREGTITGPRILTARRLISQTAGHGDMFMFLPADISYKLGIGRIADGADECRKAVREQLRHGADLIKICTTGGMLSEKDESTHWHYTLEEVEACTEEAHKTGRIVCSHSSSWTGVENALEGGVDVVYHAYWQDGNIRRMFKEKGAIFNPTLSIVGSMAESGRELGLTGFALRKAREAREVQLENFKECLRAGMDIAHGSDFMGCAEVEQGANARELIAMAEAGMSPIQAILASTRVAARGVNMEAQIGTVEAGKLADLLLLDVDPVDNLKSMLNPENILMVMKEGKVFVDRGIPWDGAGS